mmetsp:Transcript_55409/g.101440  ORF Transcript_55409/g.101440 Transcript_55409/m.101440 type:complete len:657 (-) Transcript_55409:29-1999(-)
MWSRFSVSKKNTKDLSTGSRDGWQTEDGEEPRSTWGDYFRPTRVLVDETTVGDTETRRSVPAPAPGCGQEITTSIIMSPKFDGLIGLVVVANSLTMALESEVTGDSGKVVLEIFDLIFLIVFTIELMLRAVALRWFLLQTFSDFLDIVIVLAGWIQIILMSVGRADDDVLQSFQALKVFRALRALRMLRMFVFFDGLWLAVSAFFSALWPLLWTCIFIAIILLIMSQFSVHLVGTSSEFEDLCLDFGVGCNTAYELFGTTVRSTTTLFQIMTLDEWRAVVQPICDRQWFTYLFFYFHICIASLALMNLVTAVVVENSMQRTLRNDEFQRIKKFQEAEEEKEEIRAILDQIGAHYFDPQEFIKVKDNWKTLKLMLEAMEITSLEDLQKLAEVVDVNGDGAVSLAEFLDFCLLMRGLSGDAIRMAFFQIMTDCTDKWTAMDRILKKEHAWITNSAIVARLEREVQDCFHSGTTPTNSPRSNKSEISPTVSPVSGSFAGEMMVGGKKSTASVAASQAQRDQMTVRSVAPGKSFMLKRQRPQTLWKQIKAKKSTAAILHQLKSKGAREVKRTDRTSLQVSMREITSDNDLLQELRAIRSDVQAQTQELEKSSTNLDQVRKSIHDDVLAKIPMEHRASVSSVNQPSQADRLPEFMRKGSKN